MAAGGDDNPDDGKRRLPVLQPREPSPREPHAKEGDDLGELGLLDRSLPGDEEDNRPPWHWIGFGAAATFFAWLPLSALAGFATIRIAGGGPRRISPATGVWLVAAHTLAFVIAGFLGGYLVGRFSRVAGRKEAALGGAGAGGLAWGIAASQGTPGGSLVWGLLLAVMLLLGAAAGYAGGRTGLRGRKGGEAAPPG
ncbi:MAG: hypothetical protein R3B70_23870 [Polyangiaceae bacterium]